MSARPHNESRSYLQPPSTVRIDLTLNVGRSTSPVPDAPPPGIAATAASAGSIEPACAATLGVGHRPPFTRKRLEPRVPATWTRWPRYLLMPLPLTSYLPFSGSCRVN